jgi:hypothetical protein
MEINKDFASDIESIVTAYTADAPKQTDKELERPVYNQKDIIKKILFYSLSEYISGRLTKSGQRKPFKNVVNEHVQKEVAGTDPDFKQLQLKAENSKFVKTMLLRRELSVWAKETNFSADLNTLNEIFARYGGVIAKKTIEDGKLYIDGVSWLNVITDQQDINAGPIIEVHNLSPMELRAKAGVWDGVDKVIDYITKKAKSTGVLPRATILEIEGEFPRSYIEDTDNEDYILIKAFVADLDGKKILLFGKTIKERTYKYKKRMPQLADGRALGIGVVETGFEAQVTTNEIAISELLNFQTAGKIIGITNADNPETLNLSTLEDGQIIKLEDDEYLKSAALTSAAIPEYQRLTDSWNQQYRRTTGVMDPTEQFQSGTPYSTVALQQKMSSGETDYRAEAFSLFVVELIKDWVLPYLVKKIEGSHILTSDFSPVELKEIDKAINDETNNDAFAQKILEEDALISPEDVDAATQENSAKLQKFGTVRSVKVPVGFYKDITKDVTVLFNNEFIDRKAQNQTLFEMYTSMAPEDPNRQVVWQQLTEMGGAISPSSLTVSNAQPQQQGAPQTAKANEINQLVPEAQQ